MSERAKAEKVDDLVSVRYRPHARGEGAGQLRRVDKDTAARLVRDGHAKYVGDKG